MRNLLSVRLSSDLLKEIEQERVRASRVAGADINLSAMVRGMLERDLQRRKKPAARRARAA